MLGDGLEEEEGERGFLGKVDEYGKGEARELVDDEELVQSVYIDAAMTLCTYWQASFII